MKAYLILIALVTVVLYLMFAFISIHEVNPLKWGAGNQLLFAGVHGLITGLAVAHHKAIKK